MRRLQSFPAPVASISGLQDQLQQTDWTVEDGELCFLRPTRQLFEFRKGVTSPAANGITTVQASLPGVVGQWTLLADSDQNVVYFSPQGGGADDWPALNTLMAAAAGKKTIVLTAGTYTCATPGAVPSGTVLIGSSGVTINSTLAPTGVQINSVFYAASVGSVDTTALDGAVPIGAISVTVLSVTTPAIGVGDWISLSDSAGVLKAQFYKVISRSGAGNKILWLDRPVLQAWASGKVVKKVLSFPKNILIYGNGMTISGTGDRAVEFGGALGCIVDSVNITDDIGTFSDISLAFDVASRNCVFSRCTSVGPGSGSNSGIALESNESSHIIQCSSRKWGLGQLLLLDSWACTITDCITSLSVGGAVNINFNDCTDCFIVRGNHSGGYVGLLVANQSVRTTVDASAFHGNSNAGVSIEGTCSDVTIVNCQFAGDYVGVVAVTGARNTVVKNCRFVGCTAGDVSICGSGTIDGCRSTGCGGRNVTWVGEGNTTLQVSGNSYFECSGAGAFSIYGSGGATDRLVIKDTSIELKGNNNNVGIYMTSTSACPIVLDTLKGIKTGSNTYGLGGANGASCVWWMKNVDFAAFDTPFLVGTMTFNHVVTAGGS